jgi:hypothetical protein
MSVNPGRGCLLTKGMRLANGYLLAINRHPSIIHKYVTYDGPVYGTTEAMLMLI